MVAPNIGFILFFAIYCLVALVEAQSSPCSAENRNVGPRSGASSAILGIRVAGAEYVRECPGAIGLDNQTARIARLVAGQTYTVEVNFNSCGLFWPMRCGAIFHDFYQLGQFQQGEFTVAQYWPGRNSQAFRFQVPFNARAGFSRMRFQVVEEYCTALGVDPCSQFASGSLIDISTFVTLPSARLSIRVYPERGPNAGGNTVLVQGLYFNRQPGTTLTCQFGIGGPTVQALQIFGDLISCTAPPGRGVVEMIVLSSDASARNEQPIGTKSEKLAPTFYTYV